MKMSSHTDLWDIKWKKQSTEQCLRQVEGTKYICLYMNKLSLEGHTN